MLATPHLKRNLRQGLIGRVIDPIGILIRHAIQPRRHTSFVSELLRHLLDKMIKAPLTKGVGGVAFAFGDRLGTGEKMRKPGSKGAPTAKAFKQAAKTAKGKKKNG